MAAHDKCRRLFTEFQKMFPSMSEAVSHYGPLDQKTIRMETVARIYLVFTYIDEKNWSLRTEKAYYDENQNRR